MDEKTVRVHDRLTKEALRCLLEQTGFTEPIFVSDSVRSSSVVSGGGGGGGSTGHSNRGSGILFPFLSRDQLVDVERLQGYSSSPQRNTQYVVSTFHHQVLKRVATYLDVSIQDFRYMCNDTDVSLLPEEEGELMVSEGSQGHTFSQSQGESKGEGKAGRERERSPRRRTHRPLAVYTSTALQIGLLDNPNVPR